MLSLSLLTLVRGQLARPRGIGDRLTGDGPNIRLK